MYSEQFQFIFSKALKYSQRMELLSEMFKLTEASNIYNDSYGGCKIDITGKVKFSTYLPDQTEIIVDWVKIKQQEGKITINKPTYVINIAV